MCSTSCFICLLKEEEEEEEENTDGTIAGKVSIGKKILPCDCVSHHSRVRHTVLCAFWGVWCGQMNPVLFFALVFLCKHLVARHVCLFSTLGLHICHVFRQSANMALQEKSFLRHLTLRIWQRPSLNQDIGCIIAGQFIKKKIVACPIVHSGTIAHGGVGWTTKLKFYPKQCPPSNVCLAKNMWEINSYYCKHHPAERCDLRLGSKHTENFSKRTEKFEIIRGAAECDFKFSVRFEKFSVRFESQISNHTSPQGGVCD